MKFQISLIKNFCFDDQKIDCQCETQQFSLCSIHLNIHKNRRRENINQKKKKKLKELIKNQEKNELQVYFTISYRPLCYSQCQLRRMLCLV
ncbi:hypothetical protein TTHERM_000753495 (macronuclear) [Tetrahymena thermophila SB210]|uniref:Uncharacterized protein n=1 Tax=Tetrahymena thermophila (strain SB210) TaxID=312017 RepID=W7XJ38_TETTS|nr:hypothetical protein TTHERM_000753495 [Tetrahymena thermophila SB210]EWS73824.1 hypothetical protein TTHERM_000753495 [Tetrahymena thermophila SB210]|eukprot:XP_012653647.1 hypothetical protein TTHERM_000753495 [Tetrahymena thermophila SB210]